MERRNRGSRVALSEDELVRAPGPLRGTRVLDLVDGPGVYGPKVMVSLGAEVIRVEPPGGSPQRDYAPLYRPDQAAAVGASLYFLHYNTGKKGITLDCSTSEGRKLLHRLLDQTDIVFDNGQLDHLGLAPEELAERSGLVVVSVTPFGLRSARSQWQGGDLVCQAMSGMISLYGYRDERPARFGPEQASEMSGLAAAFGALIAFYGSRRTGKGEFVDIAMERVGCMVSLQMSNASMYHQFGFRHLREDRPDGLPAILTQASDGFVQLRWWQEVDATLALIEDQGLAGDLRSARARLDPAQFARHEPFRNAVLQFAASKTRAELMEIAPAYAIHGLPVHDIEDLVRDPFLTGRAFFAEVELPEGAGPFLDIGTTVRFGETPWRLARRPPLLGEHNEQVYGALGVDRAELERLSSAGVI